MKWFLSFLITAVLGLSYVYAQTVPAPQGTAAMVCANNTVVPPPSNGKFFYVQCNSAGALITNGLSGSPGQIPGTKTNDNAAPGNVGEYLISVVGDTTALTTGVSTSAGPTITLSPGDWIVQSNAEFAPAATTNVTQWVCSISGTNGSLNTNNGYINRINVGAFVPNALQNCLAGPIRVSVAVNTQLWLVVQSNFTVSTQNAGGVISARRAR